MNITDWDALLIGDGSGAGWSLGCGWACLVVDRQTHTRKLLWGANSSGTVNIGELSAYIYGMAWYAQHHGQEYLKQKNRLLNIHIISDSLTIVDTGKKLDQLNTLDKVANRAFWSSMIYYQRQGYHFHYHWAPRLSFPANRLVDRQAGSARRQIQALDPNKPD